ncbi:hypothetical protein [Methylibium sp.]|uniref:hypothetical protein n=1 Tax=Methylibium sp. TaxID=2067992 RepID=UPI003BAC9B35
MSPADLIRSRDGSMSLTKLAAATAHLLMAGSFLRLQVLGELPFNETLWLVYGGFSIAHAAYDKTTSMVKDFKDRKLDQGEHERQP